MTGEQLSIEDVLGDYRCDVCGWYPGWSGDKGCGHVLGDVIPSRTTDPATSHAAAREIRVKAGSQRARLLWAFAWAENRNPLYPQSLTDEEAMLFANDVSATSEYAKRCSELREGGFIEPTGETRPGSAGPQRIVSRITDKGRAWIEANR